MTTCEACSGVVDDKLVSATFEAILNCDRAALIRQTRELADQGIEPLNFCRKLVEHVRNLMVCRVAGWESKLVNLPDTEKDLDPRPGSEAFRDRPDPLLRRAQPNGKRSALASSPGDSPRDGAD